MASGSGKASKGAFVLCKIHGKDRHGDPQQKYVQVPFPTGKNQQRFGGCPFCRSEGR